MSAIQTARRRNNVEKDAVTTEKTESAVPVLSGPVPRNFSLPESHDLSIKSLRQAIPAHCFERSVITSFSYVAQDLAISSALWCFAYFVLDGGSIDGTNSWMVKQGVPAVFRWAVWGAWQAVLGAVLTGVWVIAHECGHHAFSDYTWLDNTVGYILHTSLLVPYFSWQISHQRHHHHTGHMDKDQVFVPFTRSDLGIEKPEHFAKLADKGPEYYDDDSYLFKHDAEDHSIFAGSPLGRLGGILVMWTVGWPAYLINNASGQDYGRLTSHFLPTSAIFEEKQQVKIVLSDIGVLAVLAGLSVWAYNFGLSVVLRYYVLPYLWVNFWLVTITFLQHTHPEVPHYSNDAWNFLRGALATVDRDYGILNHVFHRITDTHIAHHLFSTMPHYHAGEATEHLKKVLEPAGQYHWDATNPMVAVWRAWERCRFVETEGNVKFFRR